MMAVINSNRGRQIDPRRFWTRRLVTVNLPMRDKIRTKPRHEHMLSVHEFVDLCKQSHSTFLDLGGLKRRGGFLASILNQPLSVGIQNIKSMCNMNEPTAAPLYPCPQG